MAAENLENTGKKLGIALKAETDGSGGAQNVLTREEIAAADAIIIAADKMCIRDSRHAVCRIHSWLCESCLPGVRCCVQWLPAIPPG